MSTIRVDNFGPSAGGTTYSARFLNNKYTNWYVSIIERAKSCARKKGEGEYYESHHIVPKFMGGGDFDNTVLLTAKEHFIAHLLLTKMVKGRNKHFAAFALSKMAYRAGDNQQRYNSRSFEFVRARVSEAFSYIKTGSVPWNKGLTVKDSAIIRAAALKRKATMEKNPYVTSDETKAKISIHSKKKRKPLSALHKEKISAAKTGCVIGPHSAETKAKIGGVEHYNPQSGLTKRFKAHLGEQVPDGWVKGRYLPEKYIWATDGISNIKCLEKNIPTGYSRGRTVNRSAECQR